MSIQRLGGVLASVLVPLIFVLSVSNSWFTRDHTVSLFPNYNQNLGEFGGSDATQPLTPTAIPVPSITPTPTSHPGPPELIEPEDGATLPQPVSPDEWYLPGMCEEGMVAVVVSISMDRVDDPSIPQFRLLTITIRRGNFTTQPMNTSPMTHWAPGIGM